MEVLFFETFLALRMVSTLCANKIFQLFTKNKRGYTNSLFGSLSQSEDDSRTSYDQLLADIIPLMPGGNKKVTHT